MAEKWQTGVYLIHDFNDTTKDVYKSLKSNSISYEQKINKLKRLVFVDDNIHKYKSQSLINTKYNDFTLFLFFRKHPKSTPDWKRFLKKEIVAGESIHIDSKNMNESFVMFLFNRNSEKLYAICGGYGAFTISNYTNDDFGIDILMRIIDDKGKKVLRHAKEIGVTSGLVGIAKYFRENYNFHENKNFGNIYREVSAEIDKNIAKSLGIDTDDSKQCIAKNSFKINQSITYDNMLKVVEKLDVLLQKKPYFDINDIKKINSSKELTLVKKLDESVLNTIWNNKNKLKELEESLDFINKKFDVFLSADYYKLGHFSFSNKKTLFSEIITVLLDGINKKEFKKLIKHKSVRGIDSNGDEITKDSIFNHLILEVEESSKSYFLVNGSYYEITSNFRTALNESCRNFIKNNYFKGLTNSWTSGTEGDYNLTYKNQKETIVLDTIVPENIECCDILKYDSENVYLCHVKKGFNGSMRDLTNQVYLSANRLNEDLLSDKSYLRKVFHYMEKKQKYSGQVGSEKEFLDIFNDKKICFVLAVKDTSTNGRKLTNIQQYSSNIAKFSLNELVNNMRGIGIDFKITQIQ